MDFSHELGKVTAELKRMSGELELIKSRLPAAGALIQYVGPRIDAIISSGGFDILVPTQEEGLLAYLSHHGLLAVEPAVRAAIYRHVRPGDRAIDAGANIGLHSVALAHMVGPTGKLICFEPLRHLANAVGRTLRLNGYGDRAQVIESALADEVGEITLYAAGHSPVSSIYKPQGVVSSLIVVKKTTIDDIVGSGGRLDFLKMDVEGAEPLVWSGLQRTLRENADLKIVLEWSASHFERSGASASEFMSQIVRAGFSPCLLSDDAPDQPVMIPPGTAGTLEGANLLLLRQGT